MADEKLIERKIQLRRSTEYTAEAVPREEGKKSLIARGYFILFNTPTTLADGSKEVILREAIKPELLKGVLICENHDFSKVHGKEGINARVEIDEKGVFAEVDFEYPNCQSSRECFNRIQKGLIDGASFTAMARSKMGENNTAYITEMTRLYELSVVTFPQYEETVVIARNEEVEKPKQEEVEYSQEPEKNDEFLKKLEELKGA